MNLANPNDAAQLWFVRFLAILALGPPLVMLSGCSKGNESQWENFSPAGAWELDNDRFVFDDDGKFRREVIGPNPNGLSWAGQWRREGSKIHAKYTTPKSDSGQEVVFKILREDRMFVLNWGQFQRVKQEAAPG